MRILLLLITVSFSSIAFGQPPLAVSEGSKSSIQGRAIYADNEKPVRRAKISLFHIPKKKLSEDGETFSYETTNQGSSKYALTDLNGNFEFRGVPAGSYYPIIDVQGILNPDTYDGFKGEEWNSTEKLAAFFETIVVDGVNPVQTVIRAKRSAAISGSIKYSDGDPAIGQTVEALRKGNGQFESASNIGSVKTDDRGIYRFTNLPPGEYVIKVAEAVNHTKNSDGFREPISNINTFFPDKLRVVDAEVLDLDLGVELSNINIIVPDRSLYSIRGTVKVKSTQAPVIEGSLSLRNLTDAKELKAKYFGSKLESIRINERGEFEIDNLPKGKYKISFERPYFPYYMKSEEGTKRRLASMDFDVEIVDKDLMEVTLELSVEGIVSGSISVEGNMPLPKELYVVANDEKNERFELDSSVISRIDKDSKTVDFKIGNLAPGEYTIMVAPRPSFYVKSAMAGSIDLTMSKLTVDEGSLMSDVKILLSFDVAKLSGKSIGIDSQSLSKASVHLIPVNPSEWVTGTKFGVADLQADGTFRLTAKPGDYYIYVTEEALFAYVDLADIDKRLMEITKLAEKITLKSGDNNPVTLKAIGPIK